KNFFELSSEQQFVANYKLGSTTGNGIANQEKDLRTINNGTREKAASQERLLVLYLRIHIQQQRGSSAARQYSQRRKAV
ncbi:hypothetical protein HDU84_006349, partial [Entophlyctis sp. JEL0112]